MFNMALPDRVHTKEIGAYSSSELNIIVGNMQPTGFFDL